MKKISTFIMAVVILVLCVSFNKEVEAATTEVVIGQNYSGEIKFQTNEVEWYKINITKAGMLTVNYTKEGKEASIVLYDGNNESLTSLKKVNVFNDSGSISYRLDPGKYYLKVEGYIYASEFKYTVSTSFQEVKQTFTYVNDFISDVSSKSAIPYSTLIDGQISHTETQDYYKIVLPKKGTITVDVTRGNDNMYVKLLDKNGKEIDEITKSSLYTQHSESYTLNKGTYYIKFYTIFDDTTGWYNFKISYSKSALKTLSVKKASKNSVVVKADKAGAVSGYEIRYKKGSGKWKTLEVAGSKKLDKKIKKTTRKKKYTVQIRTYYKYDGKKIYSDWSAKKSIMLK